MTKDEMKNKYSAFITEISEILGLGKPVDILKLCATTDLFFRPLEKRIAELEAEVKEWKDKADLWCNTANLKDHNIMINKELEQENADLKYECRRCVYSDCPCILSDYGKDRNGICDHFKDVFDEVVELNDELKKWKDEWQEQVQKATDEGYTRTLQTIQLTKAKELLKKVVTDFHNMDCVTVHIDKTIAEAEQFLNSEVEK